MGVGEGIHLIRAKDPASHWKYRVIAHPNDHIRPSNGDRIMLPTKAYAHNKKRKNDNEGVQVRIAITSHPFGASESP